MIKEKGTALIIQHIFDVFLKWGFQFSRYIIETITMFAYYY